VQCTKVYPLRLYGCSVSQTQSGVTVARISYKADPEKRTHEWEQAQRKAYATPALFDQEMGISFTAFYGALVFPEFRRECTVVKPAPIAWNEVVVWMACDPHPRTPSAALWLAVTRWGDHVVFAEYWPSSSYGKPGPIAESDPPMNLDDYCSTLEFLESEKIDVFAPNGYADNGGKPRPTYRRIMDYAAKGWSAYRDGGVDTGPSFWRAFGDRGLAFEPSKKDFMANRDKLGTRLRPREITTPEGIKEQSQLVIYSTCPELIHELSTYRYPTLSPVQVTKQDPSEKPLTVRCHLVDCLLYLEAEDPFWFDQTIKPRQIGERPYGDINWYL
jgi:hypothetical protein